MDSSLPGKPSAADAYFAARYPGYRVAGTRTGESGRMQFVLEPVLLGYKCPKCGNFCVRWHDARTRTVTDWDLMGGGAIDVVIPSRRTRCRCGARHTEEAPGWVVPHHRVTKRLAAFIQSLCRKRMSIKDIAEITGVGWDLVKELDEASLEHEFGNVKLNGVRRLAIDEISIHKGHKYASVIMDLENRRVVEVVKGKSRACLRPFFEALREAGAADRIVSVSVDMNAAYPKLVEEFLPGALLAYDRFHVMQNFTRDVLKAARIHSLNRLREERRQIRGKMTNVEAFAANDEKLRQLTGSEWLIVTDPEKLSGSRLEQLNNLRENNALFRDLYPLAAQIKAIWTARSVAQARGLLAGVIDLCLAVSDAHGFKPLKRFARMLRRRSEGIVNACVVGYGTNILEGANNTAKVIKRVAYGFRSFRYFALKLKAAFPGRDYREAPVRGGWNFTWNGSVETLGFPH